MVSNAVTVRTPSFPPEVWLTIFEWTTFVPNAFDMHAPDPFSYPGPWTQEQIQEGMRESMCTKRRLVLVCKAWNALATRFLYRAISIVRLRSLQKLRCSMNIGYACNGAPGAATAEGSRAWWTIRLDISLRLDRFLPRDDFADLLRCLPNLQIVVLRRGFPTFVRSGQSLSFFDTLAAQVTRSLRVLDVYSTDHFLSEEISKMPYAINGQPLRVLRIRPSLSMLKVGKRISVPDMEYLDVPWQLLEPVLAAETPPSLCHLSLDTNFIAANNVVRGSLSGVGHHLTSLEVDDSSLEALGFGATSFEALLHKVADSCPNLHNLIISLRNMIFFLPTNYLPPVERIGLRLHIKKSNNKQRWKLMCESLSELIIVTPTLKVIRIIGRPTFLDLVNHQTGVLKIVSRSSVKFLSEHGVRFEDCTGRLFHDDQSPSAKEASFSDLSLEAVTQGVGDLSV